MKTKRHVIKKQPCLTKHEENMKQLREAARVFDVAHRNGGCCHVCSSARELRRAIRRCFKF